MTRRLTVLLLAGAFAFSLHAADNSIPEDSKSIAGPNVLRAIRIESDLVKVDAVLDEEIWKRAESMSLAWETWPGDNEPAKANAEGWVAYDKAKLYIAFKAHDPDPSKIRARLTDRDSAYSDDFIGVVLDTFNDGRRGFEFFVNPLGVQMDLTQDDVGGGEDDSWDTRWESAGKITDSGYIVEMAIPFSSLRFANREGPQSWGIDMIRIYPRDQRYSMRSQQRDRDRNCYLCQISKLEGLENLQQGKNIELVPTFTAQRTDMDEGAGLESGDAITNVGISASWGFTPNLTLNAALNPDFSQIEADSGQLDVNNQFALFFPEKRPFFLEGGDFFNTPLDAVYTRTVADPDWGTKVTGKQGRSGVGAYITGDSVTNLLIPGSQGSNLTSIDEENISSVFRYRRDIGENSTIGFLYTGREGDGDYTNRATGFDAFWRVSDADTLSGQILGSQTRYPDEIATEFGQPTGDFDDVAYQFQYRHNDRDWFWQVRYEDIGEDFRADSGFMPRVDYRFANAAFERKFTGESEDFWSRAFVGGGTNYREDQSGQQLAEGYEAWGGINLPKQTFVYVGGGLNKQFYDGVMFDKNFLEVFVETTPHSSFSVSLSTLFGDQIDFANTQAGTRVYLRPTINWKPGRRTELSLSHTYSTLDVDGGKLFEANLTELRAVYQISLRMFVRAILQYTDITRNPALYKDEVDAKSEHLFPQLLFSYKLTPQTVFFLGYSDNRVADDANLDLTQQDRTIFTKVGYAWKF